MLAEGSPKPVINVHVVEPKDFVDNAIQANRRQVLRSELGELEEFRMLERAFVANAMSATIAEMQELMKIAEAASVGGSM